MRLSLERGSSTYQYLASNPGEYSEIGMVFLS